MKRAILATAMRLAMLILVVGAAPAVASPASAGSAAP